MFRGRVLCRQSPAGLGPMKSGSGPCGSAVPCLRSSSTVCSRADRSSSKARVACFSLLSLLRSFSTVASRLWILPFATWRIKEASVNWPARMWRGWGLAGIHSTLHWPASEILWSPVLAETSLFVYLWPGLLDTQEDYVSRVPSQEGWASLRASSIFPAVASRRGLAPSQCKGTPSPTTGKTTLIQAKTASGTRGGASGTKGLPLGPAPEIWSFVDHCGRAWPIGTTTHTSVHRLTSDREPSGSHGAAPVVPALASWILSILLKVSGAHRIRGPGIPASVLLTGHHRCP